MRSRSLLLFQNVFLLLKLLVLNVPLRQCCHLDLKLKNSLPDSYISLCPLLFYLLHTLTRVLTKPYEFYLEMLFNFVFTSLLPLSLLFSHMSILVYLNFSNCLLTGSHQRLLLLKVTFHIVVEEGKEG